MARRKTLFDIPFIARAPWGYVCFALNLLPVGGIGTLTMAARTGHRPSFVIGALQAVLSLFIIGWIWSVMWGIGILLRSRPVS